MIHYFLNPINKKRVRLLAILWTLLIFFLCFLPGKDFPEVKIPFIDKWVHFVLFGIFALLWMAALKKTGLRNYLLVLLASVITGYFVECVQGLLVFLGRSYDLYDVLADAVGGVLGLLVFFGIHKYVGNKQLTH